MSAEPSKPLLPVKIQLVISSGEELFPQNIPPPPFGALLDFIIRFSNLGEALYARIAPPIFPPKFPV